MNELEITQIVEGLKKQGHWELAERVEAILTKELNDKRILEVGAK